MCREKDPASVGLYKSDSVNITASNNANMPASDLTPDQIVDTLLSPETEGTDKNIPFLPVTLVQIIVNLREYAYSHFHVFRSHF